MSFRDPYTPADVERYRRLGDVTPNGVTFNWHLSGPGGARFELLREPHHTDEQIEQAKRELRDQRDVVGRIAVSLVECEASAEAPAAPRMRG